MGGGKGRLEFGSVDAAWVVGGGEERVEFGSRGVAVGLPLLPSVAPAPDVTAA